MDKKALQLASRFALPPNSLGYCGRDTAPEKLKKCILGKGCDGVTEEIDKFIGLSPYLKTISEIIGKGKYAYETVEAYTLGNDELRKAKIKDYQTLLKNFAKQGVPPWLIDELKEKSPKVFIPNHLFQVLFVGVGKMSGSVPYNMDSINNCMIRWGKVKKIGEDKLTIKLHSLKRSDNKFKLVYKTATYPYRKDFMPDLKIGDTVAVHWKQAVKKLTQEEIKNLNYWTKKVITTVQG